MKIHSNVRLSFLLGGFLAFTAGCGGDDAPTFTAPDRGAATRAPITSPCGDGDDIRCFLPWPSSTFLKADPSTKTGVRLDVDTTKIWFPDDPASLALADGFSRVSPLMVGFHGPLDAASLGEQGAGPVKLILAQADHPKKGEIVPLRLTTLPGEDPLEETLLLAYPLRPLEPSADYVAVVLDDLKGDGGAALSPTRQTLVALGREEPSSQAEADLRGYHAPTRALLAAAGVDPAHVLRVFDFTTRSVEDPTHRLTAMREAAIQSVDTKAVTIAIDKFETPSTPGVAAVVEGRLVGLPSFLDAEGDLSLDAKGDVVASGKREAPFRVMIPAGTGDYRFLMWGHGMGGNFDDDSFDQLLGENGVGKVGIRWYGWTDSELVATFASIVRMFEGTHRSSARLMHAVSDGSAIKQAMGSLLAEVLSAPTIMDKQNPAAGRKPDTTIPVWAGGSLGGTMGLVYSAADPDLHYAILNVPGAGWTHFVPGSATYSTVRGLLRTSYGGDLDVGLAFAMSQSNWDEVDGAIWADRYPEEQSMYLVQESMGDPILPNEGTAMLSVAVGAVQVGSVLSPIIGVEKGMDTVDKTALTQFKTDATDGLDIHGFAARGGPAGDAAREQMINFALSVWEGKPTIKLPSTCTGGSCDFSK